MTSVLFNVWSSVMVGNRPMKCTQISLKQHDHVKGFFNSWFDRSNQWNVKFCLKLLNASTNYVSDSVCKSTMKNVKIMTMSWLRLLITGFLLQ
jgi:hypothetical protein